MNKNDKKYDFDKLKKIEKKCEKMNQSIVEYIHFKAEFFNQLKEEKIVLADIEKDCLKILKQNELITANDDIIKSNAKCLKKMLDYLIYLRFDLDEIHAYSQMYVKMLEKGIIASVNEKLQKIE